MKVTLIGCGAAGSAIAMQLLKGDLSTINIADADLNRANKLFSSLCSLKRNLSGNAFRINATKTEEVIKILEDVDVVINAASPRCNIPIMIACINTGTNYIDLASDPFYYSEMDGTTLNEQLEYNDLFLNKGLVAITNAGFAPGFTDILCRYVADENGLDIIDKVKIYFCEIIESDKLVASWSPYILLLETIYPPTVFSKDKIIEIDFHKSIRDIKFPQPIGKIKVKTLNGHPELKTIPKFMTIPVKYVEVGGGILLNNLQLNDLIVEILSKKVKESVIFNGDILEILSSVFENPDEFAENYRKGIIKKERVCCLVEINGRKKGKKLKYRCVIQHDISETIRKISTASAASFLVSFVPSIITKEIILGKIKEKGVIAPAAISIASKIIKECRDMGLNIKESVKWQE